MRRRRTRRIRYRPGNRPRLRMPRFSLPIRRRRRRYRVVNRRRFYLAQGVLALTVAVALGLSASVIIRSIRTARLNRELVALYGVSSDAMEVQIAAPPMENQAFTARAEPVNSSPYGELSAMVMPDGSPIAVPEAAPLPSEVEDEVQTTAFHRTNLDILPEMKELTRRNPDTVGWISISGTVHLPVVYRDNTYYLDHDFTGAKNASGTLFLDESSPISADTQNLLIHGHSMNDGSMFGILTHYRKLDYLRTHPVINFNTLWEKERYAVFAVLLVSSKTGDSNYFNYFSNPSFATEADFNEYVTQLETLSKYTIPVDVKPSDALLTLSTCLDDDRLVVVARRMRAGETPVAVVPVESHVEYDTMDPVFTPALTFITDDYARDAEAQIAEKGGVAGLEGIHAGLLDAIELLMDVTDMDQSEAYQSGKYGNLLEDETSIVLELGKEPGMTSPIKTATSVADALTFQFYEMEDDKAAAFGHDLSIEDWRKLHTIVDTYTDMLFCTPLISVNVAHPLLQEIRSELTAEGRKFGFLCGHDSNVASVLSALGCEEYLLPDTVEQHTPIGVKLVFTRWLNEKGEAYYTVELIYQSTDQLRGLSRCRWRIRRCDIR